MQTAATTEFHDLPLRLHPSTAQGPLRALSVSGALQPDGRITLDYLLHGDLLRLRLPAPATHPRRRDELWHHTCLELFAQRETAADYLEFNFSPCGDWAAYRFDDYRRGQSHCEQPQVGITQHPLGPGQLRIQVCAQLPAMRRQDCGDESGTARWRIGLAAVIEADDGTLGYWALRHAGAKPDFHSADSFCVALT
ncbi:MAG: DOMON-like domain-containing protein [Steroidobacteraceae bacterium]